MNDWLATWELLLRLEVRPTVWTLVAMAALTIFEIAFPAEHGHGWSGRARNLHYDGHRPSDSKE